MCNVHERDSMRKGSRDFFDFMAFCDKTMTISPSRRKQSVGGLNQVNYICTPNYAT